MVHTRAVRWLAAIAFCSILGVASAQSKIAIINVQNAVVETAEIKKAQADLQAKYRPRQADLEKIQKELSDLQQQLQAQSGKIPPQQEADLNARGQRRQREFQRLSEDLQADVDRDRNDILQRSGQRMIEVVKKLAEERGFDVVIDSTNTFYYKNSLDVTKDAIAAYDKTYPAK